MMIKIDGLTREQCDMLNIIWGFKSREDFEEWQLGLPFDQLMVSAALVELIALAILEEDMGDKYRAEAQAVIQKIQSKFDTN
jgi:hypothetical protein